MSKLLPSPIPIALLISAVGLMLLANDARSTVRERSFIQNATGPCQSALPVFDGQIRKRPLTMQNEGSTPAFISCSLLHPHTFINVDLVEILADNNSSTPVDLTCTLVTDRNQYLPKTIRMLPNSGATSLLWSSADNGGIPIFSSAMNLSCSLPASTALSKTLVHYNTEVGA